MEAAAVTTLSSRDIVQKDCQVSFGITGLISQMLTLKDQIFLSTWNKKSPPTVDESTVVNNLGCRRQREITEVLNIQIGYLEPYWTVLSKFCKESSAGQNKVENIV